MRCLTLADLFYAAQQEAAGALENPSTESFLEALDRLGYAGRKGHEEDAAYRFVKRHYATIYHAFANRVGALDFATGVRGQASGIEDERLSADIRKELHDARLLGAIGSLGRLLDLDVVEGKAVFITLQGKQRVYRVGKLLKQAGATSNLIRRFEMRAVALEWEITADPMEVACMSYGRAWTSCMAPGGSYEAGPISDVLAGSALILFSRPGADEPCGREVLRPSAVASLRGPVIVRSGRTYGTSALLTNEEIATAIKQQTGLDLDVRVRELTGYDGPYFGVHDDYSRLKVSVSLSDVDKLTEKLRKTWAKFVDLPEPGAGGLEEADTPNWDAEFDQAVEAAELALNYWNEQQEGDLGAIPVPGARDFMGDAVDGFDEGIALRAWTHVLSASPHRFIVLADPDTEFVGAESTISRAGLDEDYWDVNYRDFVRHYEKLRRRDVEFRVFEFSTPDWDSAQDVMVRLENDPNVYAWEVTRIG